MGLTFDIQSAPPAAAEIAAARERLERDLAVIERRDWKFFLSAMFALLVLLAVALPIGRDILNKPSSDPTVVTAFVLFTPYTVFFVFNVYNILRHRRIEEPRKEVRTALASLDDLAPEGVETVVDWGRRNAAIAEYQGRVAAQGRVLVQGEMDAMKRVFHSMDMKNH
ncbi:MAG: hypothetical protein ACOY4D_02030 [Pseudomonadota bacterium]